MHMCAYASCKPCIHACVKNMQGCPHECGHACMRDACICAMGTCMHACMYTLACVYVTHCVILRNVM